MLFLVMDSYFYQIIHFRIIRFFHKTLEMTGNVISIFVNFFYCWPGQVTSIGSHYALTKAFIIAIENKIIFRMKTFIIIVKFS